MKLPKKIDMGDFTFSVSTVKSFPSDASNYKQLGAFDWDEEQVLIRKDKKHSMAKTLLHELCHAACFQQQVGKVRGSGVYEEDFVTAISNGLTMAMRQNPKVFHDIIKAMK